MGRLHPSLTRGGRLDAQLLRQGADLAAWEGAGACVNGEGMRSVRLGPKGGEGNGY
jgi:hypothetical protein